MLLRVLFKNVLVKQIYSPSRFFQSVYNVKKLYPDFEENSNYEQIENKKLKESSKVFGGFIPIKDLQVSYTKSSGPGGQNVNKVNTKVEIRFHVNSATWIPDNLKDILNTREASRINKDGFLVITSDKTRKQMLNQADCLSKIRSIIWKCQQANMEYTPSQETIDMLNERKLKAKTAVLREKKEHSLKKQGRQKDILK